MGGTVASSNKRMYAVVAPDGLNKKASTHTDGASVRLVDINKILSDSM